MGKYTITHYRGDDYTQTIICRDKTTLEPINLTGCTIKFSIKRLETDTEYIYTGNATVINAIGGVVEVNISHTVTTLWQPQSCYYDIQISDSNGKITTIIKDNFIITYDITR